MSWIRIGRTVRAIRLRLQWRQGDLSQRAHVSRSAVSLIERGLGDRLTMRAVDRIVAALGGRIDARVLWNGVELDRLLDAGHATLQAAVKEHLEGWGWIVRAEVSFNHYGDRGRIDLFAWHPATSTVLVVEIKTDLVDTQQLLGAMDVRCRLAPMLARSMGWNARHVVPAIVFVENRTTRRRITAIAGLFDRYCLRGQQATSWLRRPESTLTPPTGLLWFSSWSTARVVRISGQRVRPTRSQRKS